MTIEEESPQRVRQRIRATRSIPIVFFNRKEFTIVSLLPQGALPAAAYFVDNVIIPLANPHTRQRGAITHHKVHFDNSKCNTSRHVQEKMDIHWSVQFTLKALPVLNEIGSIPCVCDYQDTDRIMGNTGTSFSVLARFGSHLEAVAVSAM
jgi:hypothetical protein